jgi:TusA-related sulfurtransferase
MRKLIFILLAFVSLASYGQTKQTIKQLTVNDSLTIKAGNPAANKIATSIDGNGRFRWVYFSDFQDSINTGVYDTGSFNTIRIRAPFTNQIMSLGSDSIVNGCAATCDDIRWTTINGTQTVLKDSTDNVGIGTSSPQKELHVEGEIYFHKKVNDADYYFFLDENNENILLGVVDTISGTQSNIAILPAYAQMGYSGDSAGTSIIVDNNGITFRLLGDNPKNLKFTMPTVADGYVLTSDADGNATWQDPNTILQDHTGYGEMGFGDSTRTIALTQNVFSVVTNSNKTLWQTAAIDLHNVTYSGDSLIIDSAGTYQVNIQLSMDGTSGSVIRLGVFLNGVLACSCTGYQELLNNRILQLTYINIDALNAGDVLQVVITNTANNDDVDAIGGKLMVNKIR